MSRTFASHETSPSISGPALVKWLAGAPLPVLALVAAALLAAICVAIDPARLAEYLGDTDDATRLTEVRMLLAGQPWFDMRLLRFGGSEPLISHWSRLIDLPIAALVLMFSAVLDPQSAELAARVVWPTLLSGVIVFAVARYCTEVSSRVVALLALGLALTAAGQVQFTPGRIDHHNAMIIGAVGGTFALLAAATRPGAGWLAGILLGLGCAVGFEGLGLTAAALSIVTAHAIVTGRSLAGPARAGGAYAATLTLAFVFFGPGRPDSLVVCDTLSGNLIILAIMSALGVVVAHLARLQGAGVPAVFAFAACGGAAALVMYATAQPQCLGGLYGQVEPRLGAIWLDYVDEVRNYFYVLRNWPAPALVRAIYPCAGLWFGFMLLRQDRLPHGAVYMTIFVVTLMLGLWQVRLLPYASFLAVPLIALGVAGHGRNASREAAAHDAEASAIRTRRLTIALGFAVAVLVATTMLRPAKPVVAAAAAAAVPMDCLRSSNIKPLATLGAGLAANDMDIGPFLVAFTKLDVLSAPYHRLGRSILATHDLMHAPAGEAKARMKALGARYVIVCPLLEGTLADKPEPADALRQELIAGRTPEGLEPMPFLGTPLKVWRLKAE
jgi:hypothetical protein